MMKSINILLKPASYCNIICKYCFYNDISKYNDIKLSKMNDELMVSVINNAIYCVEYGGSINFSFQGGEPTLAGLSFYKKFIWYFDKVNTKNIKVSYYLQTNGIIIDEQWCKFFKDNNFLIGLSFDLIPEIHNKYRKYKNLEGTYEKVLLTKKLFDEYEIDYNILTVLTNELSKRADEVFSKILIHNIKYIQFIPCLNGLYDNEMNDYYLHNRDFFNFYDVLFKLWKVEIEKNNIIYINFFYDIIPMLSSISPITCGMNGNCQLNFIIESDGSVYPCDFYTILKYKLGNVKNMSFLKMSKYLFIKSKNSNEINFLGEKKYSDLCRKCSYFNICGGGCPRMKQSMYINEEDIEFCGVKKFLDKNYYDIYKIWKIMLNYF